jgi:SAM-dependent methyltransferase
MNFRKTSYKSYTDYHSGITKNTYDKFVLEYAEMWEWNKETQKEIIKYNIIPFSKFCKKNGKVLIAGCGTGRDYQIFSEKGFSCLGIDYSKSMISEALKRTRGKFLKANIKDFSTKDKYDGIYCESAFTHLSKNDAKKVLSNFFKNLVNKGILYVAIKIGEPGIYVSDDLGGKRYFMIHDKDRFLDLVNDIGFDIIQTMTSDHTDNNRPKWLSIVARKK